jgi:hypothetical protein
MEDHQNMNDNSSDNPSDSSDIVSDKNDSSDIVTNSSLITSPKVSLDDEWHQIVDRLLSEFNEDYTPDQVIQATEMLLVGMPTYKVARQLGIRTDTVRRWLTKYPTMAAIVSSGRKVLSKWRMAKLEEQFLTAVERSHEILQAPLSGSGEAYDGSETRIDPRILTVVAAQARYIIGLFAGQKVDVQVTHELGETVLAAKQDALDYLASQLTKQMDGANTDPIEATFRVLDNKVENQGPELDENGNPLFGTIGKLDVSDKGILCHICGKKFLSFAKHLRDKHDTSVYEYELFFMLEEGSILKSEKEKYDDSQII